MSDRVRVGVVGCGLIAQVMHLPYLAELADRFDVRAVCDVAPGLAGALAQRYDIPHAHTEWEELIAEELDAVMILTSGDHAPIAVAAAHAGRHVFTEKPMALSAAGAARMIEAAESAGTRLMVGTMKRYDPAYRRLAALLGEHDDVRLARVTTLESPFEPYVAHYPLLTGGVPDPELLDGLRAGDERELDLALGDADEQTRHCYRWILLDNLVHEFNALRGLLGEPTEVRYADLSPQCVNVALRFGDTDCHLSWVDLPGIARYRQEFAFYAADRRFTLSLPSPFLRSMPTRLIVEGGTPGAIDSWEREETVAYEEAFKCELIEFADRIADGGDPPTHGRDGLADLRLCEAVARAHSGAAAPVLETSL